MDLDPAHWLDEASHHPILVILMVGMMGGMAISQFVKMAFLAFGDTTKITLMRYRLSMYILALLNTSVVTHVIWEDSQPPPFHGLDDISSIINGFICPFAYRGVKALVAWKWPGFAEKWGDNGHTAWKSP